MVFVTQGGTAATGATMAGYKVTFQYQGRQRAKIFSFRRYGRQAWNKANRFAEYFRASEAAGATVVPWLELKSK